MWRPQEVSVQMESLNNSIIGNHINWFTEHQYKYSGGELNVPGTVLQWYSVITQLNNFFFYYNNNLNNLL